MNNLYPLKFNPILHEKVWGGSRLNKILNKGQNGQNQLGESWEISGIEGQVSIVANGFLEGNTLEELIEIYMGDLVGDSVYENFGTNFPLLIKFIDANDYLSVQVHPDDELAEERHQCPGKTEMWYIMEAEKDASLIVGFNQQMTKEKYLEAFNAGKIKEILNSEKAEKGDVFFMPAGRIHATGPGILFAEIQQSSDITYRIYDWDRVGLDGKARGLHIEEALDAIDFSSIKEYKTSYQHNSNQSNKVVKSEYFTTNIILLDSLLEKDYYTIDSFVIYIITEGIIELSWESEEKMILKKGDTVLIPSEINLITLNPIEKSTILEVYM